MICERFSNPAPHKNPVTREQRPVMNPSFLNAGVLVNSHASKSSWDLSFPPSGELVLAPGASGSSDDPPGIRRKHFHTRRAKNTPFQPTQPQEEPVDNVLECPIMADSFRAASLFCEVSSTFEFCQSSTYEKVDIANFAIQSIRKKGIDPCVQRNVWPISRMPFPNVPPRGAPLPIFGGEMPSGRDLLVKGPKVRGATIPNIGRYSLRVFGEALGVGFAPTHTAVRDSAASSKGGMLKHPLLLIRNLSSGWRNWLAIRLPREASAFTALCLP